MITPKYNVGDPVVLLNEMPFYALWRPDYTVLNKHLGEAPANTVCHIVGISSRQHAVPHYLVMTLLVKDGPGYVWADENDIAPATQEQPTS